VYLQRELAGGHSPGVVVLNLAHNHVIYLQYGMSPLSDYGVIVPIIVPDVLQGFLAVSHAADDFNFSVLVDENFLATLG